MDEQALPDLLWLLVPKDGAVRQVFDGEPGRNDRTDIRLGEEALGLTVAHQWIGYAKETRLELFALAGTVMDIVAGVHTEEEATARRHEGPDRAKSGERVGPREIVERQAGDDHTEGWGPKGETPEVGEEEGDGRAPGPAGRAAAITGDHPEASVSEGLRVGAVTATGIENIHARQAKPGE